MTKYYKFAFDSQSIRVTNRNRSNGGVALHGVLPLATEIRLKSIDKQGVKRPDELHTPEQIDRAYLNFKFFA